MHALLRHLDKVGFQAAPRLVSSGLDQDGLEMLTFIEDEFTQPGPWTLEGAAGLGALLRDLHRATSSFRPDPRAVWFPWHGRELGGPRRVVSHCDVAPWNIVARDGVPVGLIDWSTPYGLTAKERAGFFGTIVEFVISDVAWEADDAGVTPEMTAHPIALWAMAWRARSAAWIIRNRRTLESAIIRGCP